MPELTSPDGTPYRTENPAEITRLKSRGYVEGPKPPTVDDLLFHPADHKIEDVLAYLNEHPEDEVRVLAEEKAGAARKGILGEPDPV